MFNDKFILSLWAYVHREILKSATVFRGVYRLAISKDSVWSTKKMCYTFNIHLLILTHMRGRAHTHTQQTCMLCLRCVCVSS